MIQSGENVIRNRPGLTLKETFDLYVRAVQNSDLEGLFTTVSKSEDFFFLTAQGKLIDREGYYEFHKEWFSGTGWEMPVDSIEVYEKGEFGYTTAIFHYREKRPGAETYILDSYFTLIFRKEDGMWKVVADICTPIKDDYES
jgi:ketosteroid isomerase-like protein